VNLTKAALDQQDEVERTRPGIFILNACCPAGDLLEGSASASGTEFLKQVPRLPSAGGEGGR